MSQSTTRQPQSQFTAVAPLVALGLKEQQMGLFKTIGRHVRIQQKVVKYSPTQKLKDAFLGILTGAKGLVEINKRVRPERSVQRAFGREGCAEQSVISQTLDACTTENVTQMEAAALEIYQQHSRGYRHDYQEGCQLLDVDLTGMPCGKKAAFATPGYFARQRNRRGRQLGRVLATWYEEIVVDRLYSGRTQLASVFQELVARAEQVLNLDEAKRQRTILRVDSHGGSQDDINWALGRGYLVHAKGYGSQRAKRLAETVEAWYNDPKDPQRQVGWVTAPAPEYVRPVKRIAVRTPKKNGQWAVGVIISALSPEEVVLLSRMPIDRVKDPLSVLLAYAYFYDQRGGGIEIEIKEDRQGLGIHKRHKKRFAAQQVLTQLNALAHNLIMWAREWLAPTWARIRHYGLLRMIRDVFHLRGLVHSDLSGCICGLVLDQADPLGPALSPGLQNLLSPLNVAVNLGEI